MNVIFVRWPVFVLVRQVDLCAVQQRFIYLTFFFLTPIFQHLIPDIPFLKTSRVRPGEIIVAVQSSQCFAFCIDLTRCQNQSEGRVHFDSG